MIPAVSAGLHCGNVTGVGAADERWVIPAVSAGLHCGQMAEAVDGYTAIG